ncbi:hypothetical protein ABT095_22230 [Kitasatospora sp. NPDC002227]|uniref:hypothetical protein n=1 Tax=Kitasatospora sp. NPDC002227 TaxID=3154773 RepID=UPI0033314518
MKRSVASAAVLAAALALLPALPAGAAGPAPASSRLAGLDCTTWIHNNDPLHGGVDCSNNTDGTITFHADITCGWAPDVTGNSATVAPGEVGESSGTCAFYSTGIGHIGWTVE